MDKQKYNRLAIAIVCGSILVLCGAISLIAQEKQKIPVEFFKGKWAGTISGYAHSHDHGKPPTSRTVNFSMEVVKGKIHGLIKKLQPKTKFEVKTPTSGFSVRGTEYTVEVEDDGTTTVVVLDGEVEFSDKENKKTVIVKKNQKSVVKPGALPTDPEGIDPEKNLKWWK